MLSENDISFLIRGACFRIYNALGPGLLESVYEYALAFELKQEGCIVKTQVPVPVYYRDNLLECSFRLDIIVNERVIVEIKSVEALSDLHFKQLHTYLKLTDKKLGLLINFNTVNISESIHRIVNNL